MLWMTWPYFSLFHQHATTRFSAAWAIIVLAEAWVTTIHAIMLLFGWSLYCKHAFNSSCVTMSDKILILCTATHCSAIPRLCKGFFLYWKKKGQEMTPLAINTLLKVIDYVCSWHRWPNKMQPLREIMRNGHFKERVSWQSGFYWCSERHQTITLAQEIVSVSSSRFRWIIDFITNFHEVYLMDFSEFQTIAFFAAKTKKLIGLFYTQNKRKGCTFCFVLEN